MCTSPLIRYRLKRGVSSDVLFGACSSFQIKSLRELQGHFLSYSAFKDYFDRNFDYQYIKCRKCDECRIHYASEWSVRCFHEYLIRKTGAFITLTVDDTKAPNFFTEKEMIHYCKRCDKGSRFIKYPINYTLCKGLVLDFLKRLRDVIYKRYNISIRYFGCGEYGSSNDRPHYHILIFGFNFPDKYFMNLSNKGVPIYFSEFLQNSWNYGLCTVQELNHKACIYTAKYCLKKVRYCDDILAQEQYFGRDPEFLIMSKGSCNTSRCPYIDDIIKNCKGLKSLRSLYNPYCINCKYTRGGIGFDWFLKYFRDVLKIGYCTIDGVKYPIPNYYLDVLKLTDYELYDKYKINVLNHIDDVFEENSLERSQERLDVRKKIIKSKLKLSHRE